MRGLESTYLLRDLRCSAVTETRVKWRDRAGFEELTCVLVTAIMRKKWILEKEIDTCSYISI